MAKGWKGERAKGRKYSGSDSGKKPAPGTRKKYLARRLYP